MNGDHGLPSLLMSTGGRKMECIGERTGGVRQGPHQDRSDTQPGAELEGVGLPIMAAWRKEAKENGAGKLPMEGLLRMGKAGVEPNMFSLFFQKLPISYPPSPEKWHK